MDPHSFLGIRIQRFFQKNMELVPFYFKISNLIIMIADFLALFLLLFLKFSLFDPDPQACLKFVFNYVLYFVRCQL